VGEEDHAIWVFDARENGSTEGQIFAEVDGKHLIDDIEGLTLYQTKEQNLLIASSQGNNTYAVFDLNNQGKFVKSFAIIGDDERGTDGATDTDGIHAVSTNLGEEYPNGLFLAQDWYNIDSQYKAENQNFKIVDWHDIQAVLK
jgi:3-phytase